MSLVMSVRKLTVTVLAPILLAAISIAAILSACEPKRWLPLEPGVYGSTIGPAMPGAVETLEVDRENQLATFRAAAGRRIVVSF